MGLEAELALAVDAMAAGDAERALARCEALSPGNAAHPGLHLVQGRALLELGRFDAAIQTLRTAVALNPESVEAKLSLGGALQMAGRMHEAARTLDSALLLAPGHPRVQLRIARFRLEQGELEGAESLFSAAASAGHVGGALGLVELAEHRGELDRAMALIHAHASALLDTLQGRLTVASVLCRVDRAAQGLQLLEEIDLSVLTPTARVTVLHALGDAADATGEASAAFGYWTRANRLRGLNYDRGAHERWIAEIRCRHDAVRGSRGAYANLRDDRPVFFVGLLRSGSSLAEQMLACHPRVFGAGELDDIPRLAAGVDGAASDALDALAGRHLARLESRAPAARRIIDKLPHNSFYLSEIARLFPAARIVHCVRDPLDAGLSIFSRNLHATHAYATRLSDIGHFQRAHAELMTYWHAHLGLPLFDLCYEKLVAQPEATLRQLVEFCELEWDPAVLDFHNSKRRVRTASRAQIQRPLYTSSVGKSQRYRECLGELEAALRS